MIDNVLNPAPYMYSGDGVVAQEIDSEPGAKMDTPFIMRIADGIKNYYHRTEQTHKLYSRWGKI